ncbi:Tetratricopeptide repeat protein 33 [Merluccius polli]|uniref:Tetratricopeptide repeat protein 33 n=1 Tax=Merluccius polli TaxID=89951 RepID=A0AA47MIT0_MERPO|nr:Tetratricopeptide repeat protein 33 [Merluccius polli]
MASFGWKRKVGERVSKSTLRGFEAEADGTGDRAAPGEEDQEVDPEEDQVDWLQAIKRRRGVLLEDCAARSGRLKGEGALLAEAGRHWEAIKKWDEAIQLTPENALLYEMKSQVLTILQEVFPAVKAAEMAVKLKPMWWEGWQTLGRAQLSLGEVDLAVRSFQVAVHLCPSDVTLREKDLAWAQKLQRQQRAAREKTREEEEAERLVLDAPELRRDYDDFESDEVLEACAAVAERQRRLEELRRTTVVLDADGNVRTVVAGVEGAGAASTSQEQLVKARGL